MARCSPRWSTPTAPHGYYSHLIVHKDSPIKTLDDVLKNGKSLSFGNGDPNSTSGFLVPSYYVFAKNKIDAKTHFKIVRSANHETNALAVANKQVDVATNNSENLDKLKERHPEKLKDIRVIWTSPLIPLDPLVMRKDLPEATKAKIKNFFFTYGKTDAREKEVLMKISKLSGFKPSTNAPAAADPPAGPVRQAQQDRGRHQRWPTPTRRPSLAEIDKQLAALTACPSKHPALQARLVTAAPRHVPCHALLRTLRRRPPGLMPRARSAAWLVPVAGASLLVLLAARGRAPTCARSTCSATPATWPPTRPTSSRPTSRTGASTCSEMRGHAADRAVGHGAGRGHRRPAGPAGLVATSRPGGSTSRCAA